MKKLSKQNNIIIQVTTVFITTLEDVTDTFLGGITVVRATRFIICVEENHSIDSL